MDRQRSMDVLRRLRRLALAGSLLSALAMIGFMLATTPAPAPAEAADARDARADPGEHDFGDAVVVFNLEYEDDLVPPVPWAFVRARVERLGNVYYLTGVDPAESGVSAPRHWVPLADVVRMTEFASVDAAKRAIESGEDPAGGERPVFHRASLRSGDRRD